MNAAAPALPGGARATGRLLIAVAFIAALGPMVTVPALRRMVMESHGGSPAALHVFVALGMAGGAIGAPLLARRADGNSSLLRLALSLATVDAVVEASTSCAIPTALLFALRPLHGAASMGLLAILFAQFRRSGMSELSRGAAASIVALAVGPAFGGILAKHGAAIPFRLASVLSLSLVPLLYAARAQLVTATTRGDVGQRVSMKELVVRLRGPLGILATQRFAIGGLVGTWAIRARESFHMSDAKVGASFSVFLCAFAATTFIGGRRLGERPALVTCGGMTLGAAFVGLAIAPRSASFALLALGGVGAALAYAPSLARIAELSTEATRVSGMALAHAAGALGMIVGPLAGAAFDSTFGWLDGSVRASAFLSVVGIVHAMASVVLASRRAPQGVASPLPAGLKEHRRTS